MSALNLDSARIILVGGPGGVGKTTLAATLGVRLAEKGHRTLVLTVDPAQRLAQALGFASFSSEIQAVNAPQGKLSATMLDTQRYFDKIIERFAASPAQKEKILSNPIYRTMVESLGGTHEYAAMERLHELSLDTVYDKIVVDTPPMQNAVDLLRAPQRLAAFMDNSILRWFQSGQSLSRRLFQTGTKVAMRLVKSVLGPEFMDSFQTLMTDFEGLQYGFQERHRSVQRTLKDPTTAFLLVSFPCAERYRESVSFRRELGEQGIALRGILLNRVEPMLSSPAVDLSQVPPERKASIQTWLQYHHEVTRLQKQWVDCFRASAEGVPLCIMERSSDLLHSLPSLSRLGARLLS